MALLFFRVGELRACVSARHVRVRLILVVHVSTFLCTAVGKEAIGCAIHRDRIRMLLFTVFNVIQRISSISQTYQKPIPFRLSNSRTRL